MRSNKISLYAITGFSKNNIQLLRLLIRSELASKVIWIEKVQIKMVGIPTEVIAAYQASGR